MLKQNGVPYPGTVLIEGEPVRSTTGTFCLELYKNGPRAQPRWAVYTLAIFCQVASPGAQAEAHFPYFSIRLSNSRYG